MYSFSYSCPDVSCFIFQPIILQHTYAKTYMLCLDSDLHSIFYVCISDRWWRNSTFQCRFTLLSKLIVFPVFQSLFHKRKEHETERNRMMWHCIYNVFYWMADWRNLKKNVSKLFIILAMHWQRRYSGIINCNRP